ncbi:pupal cuticle protein 27 [Anastrepha ludens]|uniref:pupal cuticle protein 27 n=1 Tax=Anastrepha ludens TaxID=28586 RepID=UPI0023B0AE68|nr:pupal cuticle protein 27 [Anastrepha ludens]
MMLPIRTVVFCMLFATVMSLRQPSMKYLPPGNVEEYKSSNAPVPSPQYLAPQSGKNLHYKTVSSAASSAGFERRFSNGLKQNLAAAQIPIIRQDYTTDTSGNYNFGFETANGIQRDESGDIYDRPHSSLNVQGSYSYTGDDGRTYSVNYRADENGFHAEGDHLPTSPPVHNQSGGRSYRIHGGSTTGSRGFQSNMNSYSPSNRYLPPQRQYSKRH